jgi:hypothetical protein
MHMKSTLTRTMVLAGALGMLPLAARAQTDQGWDPTLPRPGVQKVAGLGVAKWKLGGVFADRPGPVGPVPRGTLERLYDNGAQESLFMADVQPHRAGDEVSFLEGACLGGPARVMSVEFGMYVNPGPNGEADFDAYCLFYNNVNEAGTPVNTGFAGGFFIEVRDITSLVAYTTGPIDLRDVLPNGIPIADEEFFVDLRFYEPGSVTTLSSRATPIFSGTGATIGSSADVYWRDVNENGQYDSDEGRTFGGLPHLANFYMVLEGTIEAGCAADFNGDGVVDSNDFFAFLEAYFASGPGADFNYDGQVNSQDFFDYLTAFFAGCP